MGYLQLAENNYFMLAENPKENYIFIPAGYAGASKDMHVREDYFDNLSDAEYIAMMRELAPYQSQGLSVLPIAAAGAIGNIARNLIARRQARVAAGTAKPLFKPGGLVSRIGAKLKGQQSAPGTDLMPVAMDPRTGGVQIGGTIDIGGAEQIIPEETFFQKNKNLLLIGGAVAAAGIIFLVTRKKRR
jgi:hypothetical protein